MADINIKILVPADSFALLTLDELKLALGITDTASDVRLQQWIDRYSDVIATMCNRIFAKEKVLETWRCDASRRVFLSHWPVKEADIESVEAPTGTVLDPTTYELEERSGKLSLFGARDEPIAVTYTGGYLLPDEAPQALKQACELLVRQARTIAQLQAMGGVRSISHKEARVMFFDPTRIGAAAHGQSQWSDPVNALLSHYMRFEV